jgi:RHS repeat-associated protein
MTNNTGTLIWSWESKPFGDSAPNEDPDGNGTNITLNLRFPGQYYDQESGLYYNYYRYYDPETGRYITSDPIGLEGGLNTYAYVTGNPLNRIDPFGLVEWEGGVRGIAFFTAGTFEFKLRTKKCVNGKRGYATVVLAGIGLGGGAGGISFSDDSVSGGMGDFSFSSSDVTLNDALDFVDPMVFDDRSLTGGFIAGAAFALGSTPAQTLGRSIAGVNVNPPNGKACLAIGLGGAGGMGCGNIWGAMISAQVIVGSSTVISSRVEDCCEE